MIKTTDGFQKISEFVEPNIADLPEYFLLKTIIESEGLAIFSLDKSYRYTTFNDAHAKIMKSIYNVEIELGHSLEEYQNNAEDWTIAKNNLDRALSGEHFVESALSGDSKIDRKYFEIAHSPIYSQSKDIIGVSVVVRNITEKKKKEQNEIEVERLFKTVMMQSPAVVELYDIEGLQIEVNHSYEKLWGFPASHTVGKFNVLKSKEVVETGLIEYINRAYSGESVEVPEYQYDSRGETEGHGLGRKRWLNTKIYPLKDVFGTVVNIVITHEDVTERKEAQEAILRSEENLFITLNSIGDGVISTDENGLIVRLNPVAQKMCGWNLDEAIGKPLSKVFRIINAYTREAVENPVSIVLEKGEVVGLANHTVLIAQDGTEYQIADSAAPIKDKNGVIKGVVLVFSDVTKEYQIREDLRKSEERFQLAINATNDGIFDWDMVSNQMYFSPRWKSMLGYEDHEIKNLVSEWERLTSIEDVVNAYAKLKEHLEGKLDKYEAEFKMLHKDGHWVDILARATAIFDESSKPIRLVGTHLDISDIKRANYQLIDQNEEIAAQNEEFVQLNEELVEANNELVYAQGLLLESEEKLTNIVSNANDLIAEIDENGNYSFVSSRYKAILGYSPSDLLGRNAIELFHPDDVKIALEKYKEVIDDAKDSIDVWRIRHINGDYRTFECKGSVYTDKFGQKHTVVISHDITDQLASERALIESEIKFYTLIESMSEGVGIVDENELFAFANPAAETIFGVEEGELAGKNLLDFLSEETCLEIKKQTHLRKQGQKSEYEIEILSQKNEKKYVDIYAVPQFDSNGNYEGSFAIFHDITDRKKAEIELRASEQRTRSIFTAAPVGIGLVVSRKIIEVNDLLCSMTGYERSDIIGRDSLFLYPDLEEYERVGQEKYKQIAEFGTGTVETRWKTKDGDVMHIMLSSTPLDTKNLELGVTFTALDITERKQAEILLKESFKTFSDVIASIPSGLFIYQYIEPDKLYLITGNKQAEDITGIQVDNWIGNEFNQIWTNARKDGITDKYLSVVHTGKNIELEDIVYSDDKVDGAFRINAFNIPGKRLGIAFENLTKYKQAELEIQKSERKFRGLIEGSFDAIYLMENRRYSYANPQFTALTGYSIEEITSVDFDFSVLLTDFSREVMENRYKARQRNEVVPNKFETQLRTKDGSVRDVEISNVSLGSGSKVVVMGIIRDITENKAAESKLRMSHETYLGIINSLGEAVYILDENGRFEFVNDAAEKMYGYQRDAFIGKTPEFISAPGANDSVIVFDKIKKAFAGIPQYFEFMGLRADGSIFPKTVSLTQGEFFGKTVVIATARDITESKNAEVMLRQSEDQYRSLVERMHEGLMVVDNYDVILFVNDYFCRMLGYDYADEIIGKTCFDCIIRPQDRDLYLQKNIVRMNNVAEQYEWILLKKNRSEIQMFINAVPVTNSEGEVVGSMATFIDMTERRRIEMELIRAKEHAEESDRLKSAFLANMSHEIRTPMNGIMGFSNLLAEPDLLDEERIEYAGILSNSCHRLLNTVNDVLDISKIDAGQMELHSNEFSVYKLLNELYQLHLKNFEQKNLKLSLSTDESLSEIGVFNDEQRVYQVINNLLNNAFKFTNEGGVEFGCILHNSEIEFFVADSGVGISTDNLEFVFGRFNQENLSISRSHEGAGLGLAISKGLVELLGGRIWVESKKDIGSTFRFTIPYADFYNTDSENENTIKRKCNSDDLKDCTILIAEDDNMNFLLTERILQRETNARIIRAVNGIETIQNFIDNTNICLIIMDIKMPEMDGLEAAQIIRKTNSTIPILAVTAFAMSGDKEKALKAGCDDYISKPIDAKQLIKKIKTLLKK